MIGSFNYTSSKSGRFNDSVIRITVDGMVKRRSRYPRKVDSLLVTVIPTSTMETVIERKIFRHRRWILAFICFIIIADQLTKLAIVSAIPVGGQISVISGVLNLTHVRNPGAAFGLLSMVNLPFKKQIMIVLTLTTLVVLFVFLARKTPQTRFFTSGLVLVISGAVGNLIDRVIRDGVVDFIEVYYSRFHWPSFNVADMSISVGVGLLIIDLFVEERREKNVKQEATVNHVSDIV